LAALSARGSALSRTGGRFNVGRIDERRHVPFSALYLASDRLTALTERLGEPDPSSPMDPMELAMQDSESIAVVSVSGRIQVAFDLSIDSHLQPFLEEIREFAVPEELSSWAKRLGLAPPGVVKTLEALRLELLKPQWRFDAAALGLPSNSQVFGELCTAAGIEAIFYPSTKSGQECAAFFVQNFANSESYVELDDPAPDANPAMLTRLDKKTWSQLI
jgi:hypothetical protein